ncbi:UNVERIFIED_CONTAM: hypothetical protein GTU68_060683 [Idotea baltica]|nr:hypothetical protein [Idotea baltica]
MGHSLGAHLSGLAGKYVSSGQIDRVSGFDPAGPLFYDKSSDERLDPSDASFVDVIHTNSCPVYTSCAGLAQPTGNVDFYPNGGVHQPGCTLPGDIPGEDWIDFVNGCSHGRSHDYFAESILAGVSGGTDLTFVSWPCSDYDTFEAGGCTDCGDGCLDMGFYVDLHLSSFSLEGLYYLNTKNSEPYAQGDDQS